MPIKKGEEIFYNYDYSMMVAPPWYRDLYKIFAKENPSKADEKTLKEIEYYENLYANNYIPGWYELK